MPDLQATVSDSIEISGASGHSVCVALSGGKDSVVLLDVFARLRSKHDLKLTAIHVHHGISPNADEWMLRCRDLCGRLIVPLVESMVEVERTGSGGLEAAARTVRYAAFRKVAADFLAVAQHADDQAETILHQLLRGTGFRGMSGMGATRKLAPELMLIRPLLTVPRSDIDRYAEVNSLAWVDDESNEDTRFTRNFIRHELTPIIERKFPHYRESLARVGRHATDANELLEALAKIDLDWDGVRAVPDQLDSLPIQRQVNALYYWLEWHGIDIPSHASLLEWANQLFRPSPTDKLHVAGSNGIIIERVRGQLRLKAKLP